MALTLSVVFYFVGYAVVAGAKNVETVAGGMVIHTLGNTGISFMNGESRDILDISLGANFRTAHL